MPKSTAATEFEELTREVEELTREVEEFARAAHKVLSPLNAILLHTQRLLLSDLADRQELRLTLERIASAAKAATTALARGSG